MEIISTIAAIFLTLLVLAVTVFIFGPAILEMVVEKIEEWDDIFDSLKEEK